MINNPFSCGRCGNSLRAIDPNKTENKKFFTLSRNPRRGVENPFILLPLSLYFSRDSSVSSLRRLSVSFIFFLNATSLNLFFLPIKRFVHYTL